jgi:hypothetical protein
MRSHQGRQLYYVIDDYNKNEVYDKDGKIIGKFSGYKTRPTHKNNGCVEVVKDDGECIWIEALSVNIPGLGVKCIEDYIIC